MRLNRSFSAYSSRNVLAEADPNIPLLDTASVNSSSRSWWPHSASKLAKPDRVPSSGSSSLRHTTTKLGRVFTSGDRSSRKRHQPPVLMENTASATTTAIAATKDVTENISSSRPDPVKDLYVGAKAHLPMSAILSQVGGGPLRKVELVQQQPYPVVHVEFMHEAHAKTFASHVKNRKCVAGGVALFSSPRDVATGLPLYLTTGGGVHTEVLQERPVNVCDPPTQASIPRSGRSISQFRRVLQVFRQVEPHSAYQQIELSPQYLMSVFSRFGTVVQVRPMFLQLHVAFVIEFAELESAVHAKDVYDREWYMHRSHRMAQDGCNIFKGIHYPWKLIYLEDSTTNSFYF